jgi:hypothetical protein
MPARRTRSKPVRRPKPKKIANPVIPEKSIVWSTVLAHIAGNKVSLKGLAADSDVSLSNLYDWIALRHWPTIDKAERVAKALGITIRAG